MEALRQRIEAAFEARAEITPATVDASVRADVEKVITMLDTGEARVAEKIDGEWHVHQWLKKAVLLSFRIFDNQVIDGAETKYFDKVPMKFVCTKQFFGPQLTSAEKIHLIREHLIFYVNHQILNLKSF